MSIYIQFTDLSSIFYDFFLISFNIFSNSGIYIYLQLSMEIKQSALCVINERRKLPNQTGALGGEPMAAFTPYCKHCAKRLRSA